MKSESNRPITIEDILRLKRAERPPPEFWATFDRELRAKQLAALVARRPWWQTLPAAFSGLKRFRVPLGVTAVVATAFFSVRDYQATPPAQQVQSPIETIAVQTRSEVLPSRSEADRVSLQVESAPISSIAIPDIIKAGVSGSETPTTGGFSRVAQAAEVIPVEREVQPQSPAARNIAANLAVVQSSVSVRPRNLLDVANGFESRAMPARSSTVEPLQQITPPGDTRRSRLLTAMVSTASLDTSTRTTERAASRIDEERLYDQIQRFRAHGVGGRVKF